MPARPGNSEDASQARPTRSVRLTGTAAALPLGVVVASSGYPEPSCAADLLSASWPADSPLLGCGIDQSAAQCCWVLHHLMRESVQHGRCRAQTPTGWGHGCGVAGVTLPVGPGSGYEPAPGRAGPRRGCVVSIIAMGRGTALQHWVVGKSAHRHDVVCSAYVRGMQRRLRSRARVPSIKSLCLAE